MTPYRVIELLQEFEKLIRECAPREDWQNAMDEMTDETNEKFGQALKIITQIRTELEPLYGKKE